MGTVVAISRIVLVVVFATAGVGKLLDLDGSRRAVRDFGVPDRLAGISGLLLPLAELATALALALRPSAQWGGAAALLLLVAFIGGIANALRHGVSPDCHCFGQLHSAPAGRATLIRNGVLAVLAAVVLIEGTGPAIDSWVNARSAAELVAIGLGLIAAVLAVVLVQLRAENRQLATDLNVAAKLASSAPPGLPVGAHAPEFALQSMDGEQVTLAALRARTPVLLVFASPYCPSCTEVFPAIRRWEQTLQQRLRIAVVTSGSAKENESLRKEHGLQTVLLQEDREMIVSYRIRSTPTAVLITSEGRIASEPAESVFGIEPLVRLTLRGDGVAAVPEGSFA